MVSFFLGNKACSHQYRPVLEIHLFPQSANGMLLDSYVVRVGLKANLKSQENPPAALFPSMLADKSLLTVDQELPDPLHRIVSVSLLASEAVGFASDFHFQQLS